MNIDISGRTILVSLKIRNWSGEKRDREITNEICVANEAESLSLRANKSLLGKHIKPVHAAEGVLRAYVNKQTLPWGDNGQRILKSSAVQAFQAGLLEPMAALKIATEEFLANYDLVKEDARATLGKAYDESDYPPVHKIRNRYGADVRYFPMPRSDDFRAALTQDELAILKTNCDEAIQNSVQDALLNAVNRMRAPIEHMASKLKEYRKEDGKTHGTFRDSLVENIRDIVAQVPNLNITDDPRLARLCEDMRRNLTEHEADALRASPHLRKSVASEADRILQEINGIFA
jgi:hypothetical protein